MIIWYIISLFVFFATGIVCPNSDRGNHIVVGCYEAIPILTVKTNDNGTKTYSGTVVGVLDFMFNAKQNLSYSIVVTDKKEIAKYGLGPAAFNQVANKEVDLVGTGHVITNERLQVADSAYPHYHINYRFMQPYPKQQHLLSSALKPFQPMVWMWTIVVFFAVIIVLTGISFYENHRDPTVGRKTLWELFGRNALYVITVLIGQGNCVSSQKLYFRILAAVWCLMSVVIAYSFSGNLTSYLVRPVYAPTINSFEELANSNTIHLTIEGNSILGKMFMDAKSGVFKRLGNSLRAHPENYPNTREALEKRMFSYETAYMGADLTTRNIVEIDWKARDKKECGLTLSKPLPFSDYFACILQKDSPWLQLVNQRIHLMMETGIMTHLLQDNKNIDQCLVKPGQKKRPSALTFTNIAVAFAVLGIGYAISFVVFICENIAARKTRKVPKVQPVIEDHQE